MSTLLTPSDTNPPPTLTLTDLKPESDLLHLLFHRNKNQHHSSKWWKWLGMLRRNLKKLLDPADAAGVEARLDYMRRFVVPSCYIAFTSVVANNQFAPLGLALLASLARVHGVVGAEGRVKVEEKGEFQGPVAYVQVVRKAHMSERKGLVAEPVTKEDFGEAMQRKRATEKEETEEEAVEEKEEAAPEEKTVVMGKEEDDVQETAKEVLSAIESLAEVSKPREGNSKGIQSTNERRGKNIKAGKKKKAIRPTELLLSLPRLTPPSTKEETPERKIKRKADDKGGAKKKKKCKKEDEIDDLFAGLL